MAKFSYEPREPKGPQLDIDVLKGKYEKTQNPLYVWLAISICLAWNERIPLWCYEYLFVTSVNILQIRDQGEKKRVEDSLKKALGLTGNHYKELYKWEHYSLSFYTKVISRQRELEAARGEGLATVHAAIRSVADELGIGYESVRQYDLPRFYGEGVKLPSLSRRRKEAAIPSPSACIP